MGAGKLEFWDVIPNISYAQPFIHVKITNSKTMRFAIIVNIGKGNERIIEKQKGRKEFHTYGQRV